MISHTEFSKLLLERFSQGAALVTDSQGKISYASKRALRLLDLTSGKVKNKIFFEAIVLSDDQGHILPEQNNPVWQALHEKSYNQVTPFFCRLKRDKSLVPVVVRAFALKSGRKLEGCVVELREAKRVLDLGEMKSLFLSFAAHQLKTPSSVVKGFLELMLREGRPAFRGQQWHNLQSAFEANEQLIHLSKTLLNLTRLEGGLIEPKIVPFNPHRVLQHKIAAHELMMKAKRIKATISSSNPAKSFPSDELFFSEVFEILFNNALKHSPPGASIKIFCSLTPQGVEVEVGDQGPGVPEEAREALFKTAADSDVAQNRHGLGLLMAHKYLSLLGGSIGLRPHTGQGARFYFIIPKPIL